MKGKDLLLVGGAIVAVIVLMPKGEKSTDDVISGGGSGFDFGGIFDGLFSGFSGIGGGLPQMPNFNINIETSPLVDKVVETVEKIITENTDILIPDSGDGDGNGETIIDKVKDTITETNPFKRIGATAQDQFFGMFPNWLQQFVTSPRGNWHEDWLEIQSQSEYVFEKAGLTEISTPEDMLHIVGVRESIPETEIPALTGSVIRPLMGSQDYTEWTLGNPKKRKLQSKRVSPQQTAAIASALKRGIMAV